jgi:hypothetical protein
MSMVIKHGGSLATSTNSLNIGGKGWEWRELETNAQFYESGVLITAVKVLEYRPQGHVLEHDRYKEGKTYWKESSMQLTSLY